MPCSAGRGHGAGDYKNRPKTGAPPRNLLTCNTSACACPQPLFKVARWLVAAGPEHCHDGLSMQGSLTAGMHQRDHHRPDHGSGHLQYHRQWPWQRQSEAKSGWHPWPRVCEVIVACSVSQLLLQRQPTLCVVRQSGAAWGLPGLAAQLRTAKLQMGCASLHEQHELLNCIPAAPTMCLVGQLLQDCVHVSPGNDGIRRVLVACMKRQGDQLTLCSVRHAWDSSYCGFAKCEIKCPFLSLARIHTTHDDLLLFSHLNISRWRRTMPGAPADSYVAQAWCVLWRRS